MVKKSEAPPSGAINVSIFEPISTRLVVTHPVTGEAVESLWVECVGPESEQYRTALRKMARQNLGRPKAEDDIEEAEYQADASLSVLAACVVSWCEDGFGEFDKARVKEVLKKYPSLTRQIDTYVAERKNFFRLAGERSTQIPEALVSSPNP